eukprot:13605302-Alexandrium_andersonii.AAC.1
MVFVAGGCRPAHIDPDLWRVAVASGHTAARSNSRRSCPLGPSGMVGGSTACPRGGSGGLAAVAWSNPGPGVLPDGEEDWGVGR